MRISGNEPNDQLGITELLSITFLEYIWFSLTKENDVSCRIKFSLLYIYDSFPFIPGTPGIQKHVTVLNTRNGTKVYIGMIKGEFYLFSNNKQCGHLPTANVYIHIEYYF